MQLAMIASWNCRAHCAGWRWQWQAKDKRALIPRTVPVTEECLSPVCRCFLLQPHRAPFGCTICKWWHQKTLSCLSASHNNRRRQSSSHRETNFVGRRKRQWKCGNCAKLHSPTVPHKRQRAAQCTTSTSTSTSRHCLPAASAWFALSGKCLVEFWRFSEDIGQWAICLVGHCNRAVG